jgi:hypothetical protein
MENQVTTAGLMIDLPCAPNKLKENLHVEEIQLLYKASDEQALKVVADIEPSNEGLPIKAEIATNGNTGYSDALPTSIINFIEPTGGSGQGIRLVVRFNSDGTISQMSAISCQGEGYRIGDILTIKNPDATGDVPGATVRITELDSKYFYNYKSQKPIKVLPEKEIVRVSDIVPMRAKTQEVVGNRVVYGNFLQNNKTPNSLDYEVRQIDKGSDEDLKYDQELINHTLKQGRTYQAGIVLQDRYGRASNVIINADNSKSTEFNSTYFSSYTNGGVDPLSWPGNSLNIVFDEKIPAAKTIDYNGTWNETNPLGWYTYKVVVKQQEQDYYNIYTPGSLTGNVIFTGYSSGGEENDPTHLTYSDENKVAHITLFNDNINKIPRDLNEVGPSDRVYSSSVILYNRVNNRNVEQDAAISYDLSQQTIEIGQQTVTTIRPFGEMGDWTKYKNVDLHYLNMDTSGGSQYKVGTFIYPGATGNVDPFFLDNNKNPLIATLKIDKRIGATSSKQGDATYEFAKSLTIFETKPTKSQLDIYYETSSSDTIANFNSEVDKDETFFSVGGITDVQSNLIESQDGGDFISNGFQAIDNNGVVLADSSVTMEIIGVVNSNGTPVSIPFQITSTGGSGTSVQPVFYFELVDKLVYVNNSDVQNDYLVDIKVTTLEDSNGLDIQGINLKLTNVKPTIGKVSAWKWGQLQNSNVTNSLPYNYSSENDLMTNLIGTTLYPSGGQSVGRLSSGASNGIPVYEYGAFVSEREVYGQVRIATISYSSNGSVLDLSNSNLQKDGEIRLNPPQEYSRISQLSNLQTIFRHPTNSSYMVEVRTCKFNPTDSYNSTNGLGWVDDIGFKDNKIWPQDDGAKSFNDNFEFRHKTIFNNSEEISEELVLTYKSNAFNKREIPSTTSSGKNGALMFTFKLITNDAIGGVGGQASDDYIIRFIITR